MNLSKLKVKVEISRMSKVFTDGNKNNHRDSLFQYSCQRVYIYIGTSLFSLMGNQTVHRVHTRQGNVREI